MLSQEAEQALGLLMSGDQLPNYAALVNAMPQLFAPSDEWLTLGTEQHKRFYPKFNEVGAKVFGELYAAGKVSVEFPGISPNTLQNYVPSGIESQGAIQEGLLRGRPNDNP